MSGRVRTGYQGTGRITGPLAERGFTVTAVDESPEMLERVSGARTVCAPIEDLDLGERFDVVLLASFLVHALPDARQALLATCLRHVTPDGCVLIQREGEGASWHEILPRTREFHGGTVTVVSSEPAGPGVQSVHVAYDFPDARWTQTFLSCPLTTAEFEASLAAAGLAVGAYLTADRTWVRARPLTG